MPGVPCLCALQPSPCLTSPSPASKSLASRGARPQQHSTCAAASREAASASGKALSWEAADKQSSLTCHMMPITQQRISKPYMHCLNNIGGWCSCPNSQPTAEQPHAHRLRRRAAAHSPVIIMLTSSAHAPVEAHWACEHGQEPVLLLWTHTLHEGARRHRCRVAHLQTQHPHI